MTAIDFDSWLASAPGGRYQPESLDEGNATSELQALHEWSSLSRETSRLQTMVQLERAMIGSTSCDGSPLRSTESRLTDTSREADRLAAYLKSAGWKICALQATSLATSSQC